MYTHQWTTTQSMIPATMGERGCYKASIAKSDDMEGQWGGEQTWRSQFSSRYIHEMDVAEYSTFSLYIPTEWEFSDYDEQPTLVADMHGVFGTVRPWSIYVRGDKIQIISLLSDRTVSETLLDCVRGRWMDFSVTTKISHSGIGRVYIHMNGQEVHVQKGANIAPDETGAYLKVGPYQSIEWPHVSDSRQIGLIIS